MSARNIKSIGLIGLGKMGLPISRLLRQRGFTVSGFDIDTGAMEAAAAFGVQSALSPKAVAAASDLTILLVGFDSEVDAALFGEQGVLAGAADGSIIAIASTVAPRTMHKIAARLPSRPKVTLLDIPLCRGEGAAQEGKLLIMGGGDAAAFEACRPAFSAFSDSIFHLGPLGAGQVGKMVNNLILWACISANEEGLTLGNKLGVDREALRAALIDSSASNWSLADEGGGKADAMGGKRHDHRAEGSGRRKYQRSAVRCGQGSRQIRQARARLADPALAGRLN